jgi:lipopolysaccharide export LptBFGC system permease protein LptF
VAVDTAARKTDRGRKHAPRTKRSQRGFKAWLKRWWWVFVVVPASAALFALLAAPLGLRPHRGGTSIGFGLTIVVLVAYYIMLSLTLTLGQGGRLPPVLAAWLPDVVLAAVGIALVWMADR